MPGFKIPVQSPKETGLDSCKASKPSDYDQNLVPLYNIESVRSYRWLFQTLLPYNSTFAPASFKSQSAGNHLIYLKKCDRPSVEFDEIPIHNGPRVMYRPGKMKMNTINLEFYEILGPSTYVDGPAIRTYEWLKKLMFDSSKGVYGKYKDYTFDASLHLLDGMGFIVHTYTLYGCMPLKVTPLELNYEQDAINTVTATIRYTDYKETKPG